MARANPKLRRYTRRAERNPKERNEIPSLLDNIKSVNTVGRIDLDKYAGIADSVVTDEVIITAKQIEHIQTTHAGDFEKVADRLGEIVADPDYVLKDKNNPDEAVGFKQIEVDGKRARVLLILQTEERENKKNSIITLQIVGERTLRSNLNNTKRYEVVYKREGL